MQLKPPFSTQNRVRIVPGRERRFPGGLVLVAPKNGSNSRMAKVMLNATQPTNIAPDSLFFKRIFVRYLATLEPFDCHQIPCAALRMIRNSWRITTEESDLDEWTRMALREMRLLAASHLPGQESGMRQLREPRHFQIGVASPWQQTL
jgi:hypothetical protein